MLLKELVLKRLGNGWLNKMKVLFTGFHGYRNTSKVILDKLNNDKIIFKNNYNEIDKSLNNVKIEDYDLIIMLGVRNNLKKSIRLEVNSFLENKLLMSTLDCNKMKNYFKNNNVSCLINNKPTNYLCNYAYFKVLERKNKTIFIHLPELKNIVDLNKLIYLISNIKITTCI